MNSDPSLKLGDVTSLNVNIVSGGVQHNIIPSEFTVKVDMRITPTDKMEVRAHFSLSDQPEWGVASLRSGLPNRPRWGCCLILGADIIFYGGLATLGTSQGVLIKCSTQVLLATKGCQEQSLGACAGIRPHPRELHWVTGQITRMSG